MSPGHLFSQHLASVFLAFKLRVTGQNGCGQNGTDKMVLDKMVRTKWYGQNGTILHFVYTLIQLNSIIFSNQMSQINDKHIEES